MVPVGDELLCWFDRCQGLIFSNVSIQSPNLRYGPPPAPVMELHEANMSVTAGGSTVKFINIFPRCCCGAKGATKYHNSLHAYTVRTWTLRMDDYCDGTAVWVSG